MKKQKLLTNQIKLGPAFKKPKRKAFRNDADVVRWTVATVKGMDSWLGGMSSGCFQLACFLIASTVIGADEQRLAAMFDINPELAKEWVRNLRTSGSWLDDGTVVHDAWLDQAGGKVDFALDLLTAQGFAERRVDPLTGRLQYRRIPGRDLDDQN